MGPICTHRQVIQQDYYNVLLLLLVKHSKEKNQIYPGMKQPMLPLLHFIYYTCSQTSSGSCSSFALCYYWKRSPDLQETGRCSKGWFLGLCPQHFFTGDVQSMSHVYIFLPFISQNKIKSFSFLLKHLRLEIESKWISTSALSCRQLKVAVSS